MALVAANIGLGGPVLAQAQGFGLTPFGGWRFGGGVVDLGTRDDVILDDTLVYGLIFSIPWNAKDRSRLELV